MVININREQSDLFQYAREICETHKCEECPMVGYQPLGNLVCETGGNRKPKEKANGQATGREDNKTDQSRDDEGEK